MVARTANSNHTRQQNGFTGHQYSGTSFTNHLLETNLQTRLQTLVFCIAFVIGLRFVRTRPGRIWVNRKPLTRSWSNHVQSSRKGKCVITAAEANKEVAPARTRSGLNPRPGHSGFSHVGIVLNDGVGQRAFVSPPFRFGAAPYSPRFTLVGSQDLDAYGMSRAESLRRPLAVRQLTLRSSHRTPPEHRTRLALVSMARLELKPKMAILHCDWKDIFLCPCRALQPLSQPQPITQSIYSLNTCPLARLPKQLSRNSLGITLGCLWEQSPRHSSARLSGVALSPPDLQQPPASLLDFIPATHNTITTSTTPSMMFICHHHTHLLFHSQHHIYLPQSAISTTVNTSGIVVGGGLRYEGGVVTLSVDRAEVLGDAAQNSHFSLQTSLAWIHAPPAFGVLVGSHATIKAIADPWSRAKRSHSRTESAPLTETTYNDTDLQACTHAIDTYPDTRWVFFFVMNRHSNLQLQANRALCTADITSETAAYTANSSSARQQNGVTSHQRFGASFANQRPVTYTSAGSPANGEPFEACGIQSDTKSVLRVSRMQSEKMYEYQREPPSHFVSIYLSTLCLNVSSTGRPLEKFTAYLQATLHFCSCKQHVGLNRMMPLVGGFSQRYPVSPTLPFRHCYILTSYHPQRLSQDLDVKSGPNLSTPLLAKYLERNIELSVGELEDCSRLGVEKSAGVLGSIDFSPFPPFHKPASLRPPSPWTSRGGVPRNRRIFS
ncbi:hypothetical protein PR048_018457 [Dryococelus australis]|uniref:Uncharacterized protein n=1 Tax=Dryococelus australis TaxID=614101 RepID=A0ABQ9HCH4_9NEOP|nr:hypothetical protein PR048_018457 [Dryococelus australis]